MTNAMSEPMRQAVAKEPPISWAQNRLNMAISELDSTLKDLFAKLGPMMGPDYSESAPSEAPAVPETSEVARALNYEIDRIEDIIRAIRIVHGRVEI